MHNFSFKIFCLTVPNNLVGVPFCAVFQKIPGIKKVWIRGGGEYQDFPSKIFCLTVPEISVGESFLCFTNFGHRKSLDDKSGVGGGGYNGFPSKFLSHCTKIFHWRTIWCFRKFPSSKIFMHRRGEASRFCRNFLSHRTEAKSFVKKPFCFPAIFWYRKKFMDKRELITIFSRNFYVSQCRKLS